MDIVDSCRIWESHAEPAAIENWCQDPVCIQPKLLMPPLATGSLEFRVGSVMPALDESIRRVSHSSADRELLICTVLEPVGARLEVISGRMRSRELELLLRDVTPVGSVMKEKTSCPASLPGGGTPPHTDDLGERGHCFSCGFFRCPQLDISFPYKMPGWSVDVRDGQYRASRMRGDEQDLRRGKEGWFGREGQPPGLSVTVTRLTQTGVIIRLGNDRKMTLMDPDGPRTRMASQAWGVSLRLKRIAAIVRRRIMLHLWWIQIQTWTRSGAQSGMGAIRLLWGAL